MMEVEVMIEGYITVKEAAEKWGLHVRSVQLMCSEGRIPGIVKFGRAWAIPSNAEIPKDGRVTTGKYRNWRKKETE
nr:helix-turn-helix domain-containing protein [Acetivibrio ethanolgignens]